MADHGNSPSGDNQAVSTTEARQGRSGMGVRYVLVISTLAALVLMGLTCLYFFPL